MAAPSSSTKSEKKSFMAEPDFLHSFYKYAKMEEWDHDFIQKIIDLSNDENTHGAELCRVFKCLWMYSLLMKKKIAERKEKEKRRAERKLKRIDPIGTQEASNETERNEKEKRRAERKLKRIDPVGNVAASSESNTIEKRKNKVSQQREVAENDSIQTEKKSGKREEERSLPAKANEAAALAEIGKVTEIETKEQTVEKGVDRGRDDVIDERRCDGKKHQPAEKKDVRGEDIAVPPSKEIEIITIDCESEDDYWPLFATASKSAASASAAPAVVPSAMTKDKAKSVLAEIKLQIEKLNDIKLYVKTKGIITGPLVDPLPLLNCNGTPPMMMLEVNRVDIAAEHLLREFEERRVAGNTFPVVGTKQIRVELARIRKSIKSKKHVQRKDDHNSTESKERGEKRKHDEPKKSKDDDRVLEKKSSRDEQTEQNLDGNSKDERTERITKKRDRNDSGDENHERPSKHCKRDERESRDSKDEKESFEKRRRNEERKKIEHWCAFCSYRTLHKSIHCNIYASLSARRQRIDELKLCFHCLEPFNANACCRPEHRKICPICGKHTSNPALCKFNMKPSLRL